MPEIPSFLSIYVIAVLHSLTGLLAANIAKDRGYNFSQWLAWGAVGGTGTLVVSLFLKSKSST